MAGLKTHTLLSAAAHILALHHACVYTAACVWAHLCADAGVCCHDCPTGTTGEQCVVLIARQPKQSDHAQLHGTQWVRHIGQCSV